MAGRLLARGLALSVAGAAACAEPSACAPVALASSARTVHYPTAVLLHGLDSSRETWRGTLGRLAERGVPALALDLRGHGESALGDAREFSAEALANDVLASIRSHGVKRAVLVGHSMGGRVAVRAAAIDERAERPLLCALVIEDMDMRERAPVSPPSTDAARAALARFAEPRGRFFHSWDECKAALLPFYEPARIDGWRGTRVRERAGGWWSDINPHAQLLARERVLASSDGTAAWAELGARAGRAGEPGGGAPPLAVHVWHADEAVSACQHGGAGGLDEMRRVLPSARTRAFAGATHSIHGSAETEFVRALCALVDEAGGEFVAGTT
ncbi:hypothetical protein KFE25_006539 [Diacronema lutheri]|uniref:AB hydrolase-1 domain-containing protein n=1 Tax=Diacronema lutheri TaxID=2081491 RepID=A0A8J6C340_DIALT|nr:hypothetical protein KFE25_006539 [Diacronema lutheri]